MVVLNGQKHVGLGAGFARSSLANRRVDILRDVATNERLSWRVE
jgi:hypothetical protein